MTDLQDVQLMPPSQKFLFLSQEGDLMTKKTEGTWVKYLFDYEGCFFMAVCSLPDGIVQRVEELEETCQLMDIFGPLSIGNSEGHRIH